MDIMGELCFGPPSFKAVLVLGATWGWSPHPEGDTICYHHLCRGACPPLAQMDTCTHLKIGRKLPAFFLVVLDDLLPGPRVQFAKREPLAEDKYFGSRTILEWHTGCNGPIKRLNYGCTCQNRLPTKRWEVWSALCGMGPKLSPPPLQVLV